MRTGRAISLMLALGLTGCGTTRMTDTTRAASEMMLISQAIDTAVAKMDFTALKGKTVYLDEQFLKGTVDEGYLISTIRQQLLAHGALLQDDRDEALYVVEPRSGGVGTDKHSLLIGTPAMSLPPVLPGIPTTIPEIALIKNSDQKGVAKIAVFAYNRVTGRALWQSGMQMADSNLKDTWIFGAGPYSRGSIRPKPQIAGEEIPSIPLNPFASDGQSDPSLAESAQLLPPGPSEPRLWSNSEEPAPPQAVPFALLGVTGPAPALDRRILRFGLPLPDEPPIQVARPAATPTIPVPPVPAAVPVSTPNGGTIQPPPAPLSMGK